MLLYFYLLRTAFFAAEMRPALAESWRRRSFVPCNSLCAAIVERAARPIPEDCVLRQVARGLPFAREFWHALAGELLVFGCDDMPLLQLAPATLCCVLAPGQYPASEVRAEFAPIQQVLFGSRDLRFGGACYRPDHAGWNDAADLVRLQHYLQAADPSAWRPAMLEAMPELPTAEDREEELAFVRDWWPALVTMVGEATSRGQVIVCERM